MVNDCQHPMHLNKSNDQDEKKYNSFSSEGLLQDGILHNQWRWTPSL